MVPSRRLEISFARVIGVLLYSCYTAAIQLLYSCRVEGVLSGAEGNVEFENPDLIAHREILKFAIE